MFEGVPSTSKIARRLVERSLWKAMMYVQMLCADFGALCGRWTLLWCWRWWCWKLLVVLEVTLKSFGF